MHMDEPQRFAPSGNYQRGHAWTLAYQRDLSHSLSVLLEAIQVDDALKNRVELNLAPGAVERMLQLSVRWDMNWQHP